MSSNLSIVALVVLLTGCGARVEGPTAAEGGDAAQDTTPRVPGPSGFADAGSTEAAPPVDIEEPVPAESWGDGPAITSLDLCDSSGSVDKIIAHASAPLAPFPSPAPIQVIPGGTNCATIDARSPTGEYAFSGKCGLVEKTQPVTLVVRAGIKGVDGRAMAPGTHVFYPTTNPGRLCGTAFHEIAF